MKKEGKKWAKGKYPFTSAGSMRRLLTTGVTVPFPVSTISNNTIERYVLLRALWLVCFRVREAVIEM